MTRLALGLSGGGDSTALLLALREAAPDIALHAYIVDHGLRAESGDEARLAADTARAAGAAARILGWTAPRKSQARARVARHRLLAEACRADGVSILCLAHTREDRIETLRMRARRAGPPTRLAGPGPLDPSPVWPEGRGLLIARPLLDLTRHQLRAYLRARGAAWIEDPSNADPAYERTRLRADPVSETTNRRLIEQSEAARRALEAEKAAARAVLDAGAVFTSWGGARLDPAAFSGDGAPRALETLLLAVSGRAEPPAPGLVESGLRAVQTGASWTGAGALLTKTGFLGRDPGAAGRADGAPAPVLHLAEGEIGVFDGRWEIGGPARLEMLGARRPEGVDFGGIPAPFRVSLPFEAQSGAVIAGERSGARLIVAERITARLMALKAPAWFDGVCAEARACAALAKPRARSNIGS
ncbi:MAG: tRNA lysidine(34) synthetase TilS [Oceanicaulis sp.]